MKNEDAIALQAFLVALTHVDSSIAQSLSPQLKAISPLLRHNPPKAINQLRELVTTNAQLNSAYYTARIPLQQADEARERNKHFAPRRKGNVETSFRLENVLPPETLKNVAITSFESNNPQETAATELNKANASIWQGVKRFFFV